MFKIYFIPITYRVFLLYTIVISYSGLDNYMFAVLTKLLNKGNWDINLLIFVYKLIGYTLNTALQNELVLVVYSLLVYSKYISINMILTHKYYFSNKLDKSLYYTVEI